jgi:hypothetical protein
MRTRNASPSPVVCCLGHDGCRLTEQHKTGAWWSGRGHLQAPSACQLVAPVLGPKLLQPRFRCWQIHVPLCGASGFGLHCGLQRHVSSPTLWLICRRGAPKQACCFLNMVCVDVRVAWLSQRFVRQETRYKRRSRPQI